MASQRYRFLANYRNGDLAYTKDQVTEFDPDFAAWLNRDAPGCVEPVDEAAERAKLEEEILAKAKTAEEKARAKDAPTADRMQKAPTAKREG
jgi:hypothetical protein